MENKRYFLSINLADGMVDALKDRGIVIPMSAELDELKGKELFSSVRNKGVLGTLREKWGIVPKENVEKFSLEKGDVLYTLKFSDKRVFEYAEAEKLPDYVTIIVTKYEIK